jgi:small redox-active disulfide protein 2
MKEVIVLGSGCARCVSTAKLIEEVAKEKGVEIKLDKVTDMAQIAGFGVMSTPGVIVDGKLVHSGGVPDRAKISAWL